jgi:peptide-methionine (S)-S-oxide reductase
VVSWFSSRRNDAHGPALATSNSAARLAQPAPSPVDANGQLLTFDKPVEVTTLGAGCFWCLDAVARRTDGFLSSVVGYGGGPPPAPTYYNLHQRGGSGFVEGVQLTFDPSVIDFRIVLDLFFQSHDPTTPNRDGANRGPEYHSTIFFHSEEQRRIAEDVIAEQEARLGQRVVTAVRPFTTFFPAEPEHQDFYNANPGHPYCRVIIVPKLEKVLKDS